MSKISSMILPHEPAANYFSQVLAVGGIGNPALVEPRLRDGTFYAIVPERVEVKRAEQFSVGGLLPSRPAVSMGRYQVQPVSTAVAAAASIARGVISKTEDPALWIHEAQLNESEVRARNVPFRTLGSQLYLVENPLHADVEEMFRYSNLSWHFLAFVTNSSTGITSIDQLMQRASLILVGAYDGESFLYWCPAR